MRLKKPIKKTIIKLSIGLSLLLIIFQQVGFTDIVAVVTGTNPIFFPLVGGCLVLSFFINGISLWKLIDQENLPLKNVFVYSALSWSWGIFTPGRIGELSLVYDMKKDHVAVSKGSAAFLIARMAVLGWLILIALLGMAFYIPQTTDFISANPLFLSLFALLLLVSFFIFKKSIPKLLPEKIRPFLLSFGVELKIICSEKRTILFVSSALQFIKLLIFFFITYLGFCMLGTEVPFLDICIYNSFSRIISLVPVSINGLGVKEGIQVYLYSKLSGVEPATVAALGIIINVLLYLYALMIISVQKFFFKRHE